MAAVELAGHTNSLSHEISTGFQRVFLRTAHQHEWMIQARDIQLEEILALDQGPAHGCHHLGRREPCIFNCLGNQGRVKGLPRLGKYLGLSLHQIHIGTTNAIQALQGLLGPIGSKASHHAFDFHCSFNDLCRSWCGGKKAGQC